MSLKSPVTSPAIDPWTVRIVVQRLNHYATPGPPLQQVTHIKFTDNKFKRQLLYFPSLVAQAKLRQVLIQLGTRGSGCALQVAGSVSFGRSIALRPDGNEDQEYFLVNTGVRRCVGLTNLPLQIQTALKYGSLNMLEPSGPVQ